MLSMQDVKNMSQAERVYTMLIANVSMCPYNTLVSVEVINNSKVHAVVQNVRTLKLLNFNYKFYTQEQYVTDDFISLMRVEFPSVRIEERSE